MKTHPRRVAKPWGHEIIWAESFVAVTDAEVLEASTPHLDDLVRFEDRYGRSSEGP